MYLSITGCRVFWRFLRVWSVSCYFLGFLCVAGTFWIFWSKSTQAQPSTLPTIFISLSYRFALLSHIGHHPYTCKLQAFEISSAKLSFVPFTLFAHPPFIIPHPSFLLTQRSHCPFHLRVASLLRVILSQHLHLVSHPTLLPLPLSFYVHLQAIHELQFFILCYLQLSHWTTQLFTCAFNFKALRPLFASLLISTRYLSRRGALFFPHRAPAQDNKEPDIYDFHFF